MTFQPPPPPSGNPPDQGHAAPPAAAGAGATPAPAQYPPAQYPPAPPQYGGPPQSGPPQYGAQQPGQYPAPGYGAPASGGGGVNRSAFDPKSVNPMDWALLGIGFLVLVLSFFSYYTIDYNYGFGSVSGSVSAWHGFFGWFAAFVTLLSAALIAVELFAPQVQVPVPIRLASLGGFALATLCVILALVIYPGSGTGAVGHGFGYWASLILIIAGLVLSVLRLKATGGKLPWEKGSATPGGSGGGPGAAGPGYAGPPSAGPPPAGPPSGYGPPSSHRAPQ